MTVICTKSHYRKCNSDNALGEVHRNIHNYTSWLSQETTSDKFAKSSSTNIQCTDNAVTNHKCVRKPNKLSLLQTRYRAASRVISLNMHIQAA